LLFILNRELNLSLKGCFEGKIQNRYHKKVFKLTVLAVLFFSPIFGTNFSPNSRTIWSSSTGIPQQLNELVQNSCHLAVPNISHKHFFKGFPELATTRGCTEQEVRGRGRKTDGLGGTA